MVAEREFTACQRMCETLMCKITRQAHLDAARVVMREVVQAQARGLRAVRGNGHSSSGGGLDTVVVQLLSLDALRRQTMNHLALCRLSFGDASGACALYRRAIADAEADRVTYGVDDWSPMWYDPPYYHHHHHHQ